jgi:RNA:NAD 2'-phosphotransferase (TPT1/KptA family)
MQVEKKDMGANMRGTSKFISLILRHKPEAVGITLDKKRLG